jgi:DNA-binding MarR family transcriptional regulator
MTYLIRRAQLIIYARLTECLREYNLTPMQYLLLSLSRRGGAMSSADLARRFAVTPQSMNEMITALEGKRLITRRRSTEHRRILRISLTPAGENLLRDCDLRVDGLERSLFAALSPTETRSFRRLLTTFISSAEPDRATAKAGQVDSGTPIAPVRTPGGLSGATKAAPSRPRLKFVAQ